MTVIIGVDPHKSTHTAVAIDGDERPLALQRLVADRCQTQRLLAWSPTSWTPSPGRRSRRPRRCSPRSATPRTASTPSPPRRLRRPVPGPLAQGRRQDRQRPGPASHVLRLPRRALAPLEDVQPDRVALLDRPAAQQGHQGPWLTSRRLGDGVQAHRVRPGPLASGQRAPPRCPRACWRHLQEGGTDREQAHRGSGRRVINAGTRSTTLDHSSFRDQATVSTTPAARTRGSRTTLAEGWR
jgi:hypothetical protein